MRTELSALLLLLVLACAPAEPIEQRELQASTESKQQLYLRLFHRSDLPLSLSLPGSPGDASASYSQIPSSSLDLLIQTSPKIIQGRGDCMLFGTTHFFEQAYYLTFHQAFDASQQYFTYYFASNAWKYPGKTHLELALSAVRLLNDGMLREEDQPYDQDKPWLDPPDTSVMGKLVRPLQFEPQVITETGNADWSEGDFSSVDILAIKEYIATRRSPSLISVTDWGGFVWHVMLVVGWDETGLIVRDSLLVADGPHNNTFKNYFTHIDYMRVLEIGIAAWAAEYKARPQTVGDFFKVGLAELRRKILCAFTKQCTGNGLDLAIDSQAGDDSGQLDL